MKTYLKYLTGGYGMTKASNLQQLNAFLLPSSLTHEILADMKI